MRDQTPEPGCQEFTEYETEQTAKTQDSVEPLEPETDKKKKRKKKKKNQLKYEVVDQTDAISILECEGPIAHEEDLPEEVIRFLKVLEEKPLVKPRPVKFNKKSLNRMDQIFKMLLQLK